ncbi:MAG: outer membrane protein assembly factor BamE [Chthoniobacterales bacterium]|nr:outer membrane protein assembly factor BamE [Chthoniobacterales bacterium]
MKKYRRLQLLGFVVSLALALASCQGKRLTKANVAEVTEGMSRKQVESILGPPTSVDSKDLVILKRVTYTYQQGDESVTVVFTNDKVASKENSLHD